MDMKEKKKTCSVWVNWKKRIVSFEKAEGFEKLIFPTQDEKFHFVIKKGSEGYGIQ